MINIKDFTWDVAEDEYRSSPAISYSNLSRFAKKGPSSIIESVKEESKSLSRGSLFDCLLTNGENFKNLYIVVEDKPIDSVFDALMSILRHSNDINSRLISLDKNNVLECIKMGNYDKRLTEENLLKRILTKENDNFYEKIKEAEFSNKTIITVKELKEAESTVDLLYNHEYTSELFRFGEIHYQLKFITEIDGIQVRCMIDMLTIDNKNKLIYPTDIKTTSSDEEDFEESFLIFRYDIQSTLYSRILRSLLYDKKQTNYNIMPFRFLVVNPKNPKPLIWTHKESVHDIQKNIIHNGKVLSPWYDLLKEYQFHLDKNIYTYSKRSIENNGFNRLTIKYE